MNYIGTFKSSDGFIIIASVKDIIIGEVEEVSFSYSKEPAPIIDLGYTPLKTAHQGKIKFKSFNEHFKDQTFSVTIFETKDKSMGLIDVTLLEDNNIAIRCIDTFKPLEELICYSSIFESISKND